MSSRLDVVKSLVRSAASSAGVQLGRVRFSTSLRKRISDVAQRRLLLPDSKLTAAVARVADVSAATVSTRSGQLRVDVSFCDGTSLLVHVIPVSVTFAPRGAKEWSVRVEPPEAAYNPRCSDIVAALATEVAMTLWGPFLRSRSVRLGASARGRRALATRHGSSLVVDLRSIPAVRSALTQPLLAAAIEAFALRAVEVTAHGLQLIPNVAGLDGP
jgi:hypothetical protein